jgi:hypothetical protein
MHMGIMMQLNLNAIDFRSMDEFKAICQAMKANANPRTALSAVLLEAAVPPFLEAVQKYRRANTAPYDKATKLLYLEALTSAICSVAVSVIAIGASAGEECDKCQVRVMDTAMHGVIASIGDAVGEKLAKMVSDCEIIDSPTIQ